MRAFTAKYCTLVLVDLTSPLNSIIPTLEAAALEVLAGTESALGVTQIYKLAPRGSRRSFEPVLDRLVGHGLVVATPGNRGHLYRLNRDHLLAPVVVAAANARTEFLHRLGEALSRMEPRPLHASVFGSTARRESGPESDVDLLIVVPDDLDPRGDEWMEQMSRLEDYVLGLAGNRLECLVFTREHLLRVQAEGEPIVDSLLTDGITLAGVELNSVLSEVRT